MKKPAFLRVYDEIEAEIDDVEEQLRKESEGQTDARIYDWATAHLHLVSLLRHKARMGRHMHQTAWLCFVFMVCTWVGTIAMFLMWFEAVE